MPLVPGAVELTGHGNLVNRIVPLPGGDLAATASDDKTVRVFSSASGALRRTLAGHGNDVCGLAALGGDLVAAGDSGGWMCVWNARTGELTHDRNLGGIVCAVAALGAGRFVASVGRSLLLFGHRDGRGVTQARQIPSAHASVIWDIAACGGRFATASADATAAVWDVATLERMAVLDGHSIVVTNVAMNGRWIVTGSCDDMIRMYDGRTFQCVRVLSTVHTGWVRSVTIVDSDHVLSGSFDCTVCVSDLRSGALVARVQLPFGVLSAAITSDGRLAAAGERGSAVILPAPAEAAHLMSGHNLALSAAAHPGPALRAIFAIETGADQGVLRRVLTARRVHVR
jgi:WD40 repeat protein